MVETKTVYVVAWEYESGGGFDWYADRANAVARFERERDSLDADTAYFFYPYTTKADEPADATTDAIDANLIECCAGAAVRAVGANVLAYWKRNGFDMGDAVNPARRV